MGGFVDTTTHGLCFLTCAHVLHDIRVTSTYLPQTTYLGSSDVEVVQPSCSYTGSEKCGKEVAYRFGRMSSGTTVDAALVQVDQNRLPDRGIFAGLTMQDLNSIGTTQ